MPAAITLARLRARGACKDQLALFKKLFGGQVEITVELCVKHAADFDWGWAARNLLTAPARAAYEAATAGAWASAFLSQAEAR